MNNYIGLHSSVTTSNPSQAQGIYIIYNFSRSASTGGAGVSYTTTYYDITTKKILGAIHGTN